MNDEELNALEAAAKAATPGPWTTAKPQTITDGPAKGWPDREVIAGTPGRQAIYTDPVNANRGGSFPAADCEFIAMANPERILRLIAELRAARYEIATARCPKCGPDTWDV